MHEEDLTVKVDARSLEGPRGSEIGIVCRWQNQKNYVAAAVRGDGMVSIWKKTDDVIDRWQDWQAVAGLGGDAPEGRTLRLTCNGSDVRFAVDGTEVAAATDPQPRAGSLALMAGLLEPGNLRVAFDQLEVSRP